MDERSHTESDARIGTTFAARYLIRRRIARGSMGVVYEAEQVQLGRAVALKVLDARPSQVSTHNIRARFLREASLLSKLNHPNTVRVYDYGVEEDRPFLVMELVQGVTLRELLAEGVMPALRAVRICQQVCGSLHEAHRSGVIHRDLKPANVLISRGLEGDDLVKVVDFGLVKEIHGAIEMTGEGLILGTPQFMAPEQIQAQPLDQRCDIYAMGVLLFRCISGKYPHAQGDPATVLMAHLKDPPRKLVDVSPALQLPEPVQWTIDKCLAKNRDDRFVDARELVRSLKLCEAALLDEATATLARPVLVDGRVDLPADAPEAGRSLVSQVALGLVGIFAIVLTMFLGLVFGYLLITRLGAPWVQEML